jgi:hypothetical protein
MADPALTGEEIDDSITAYHGTPHDFERFDMSKIGSGQGEQAYGHGLYFAENEDVAKTYRDDLSSQAQLLDGRPVDQLSREGLMAKSPSPDQEVAQYVNAYGRTARNVMSMRAPHLLDHFDALTSEERLKPAGKMYEVRIKAHPDSIMDWDKKLSEQPNIMRALAEQHANLDPSHERFEYLDLAHKRIAAKPDVSAGAHAHYYLKQALGNKGASDYLSGLGIKGIKYLDEGSRGVGQGTQNYVVFDDSLVNVARKYRRGGGVEGYAEGGGIGPRYLNTVHKNPSIATLRNVTKNSPNESSRIAIDRDGNLWAAAADRFLHQDLGDGESYENPSNHAVVGYVRHQDGNYTYGAWNKGSSFRNPSSHPKLDALDKNGFINGSSDSGQFSTFANGGSVDDDAPYHQTPEFQNWFGDSVTHADNVPTTYYHGTSKDKDYQSFNVGRHGVWMTADPNEASQYAEQNDSQNYKYDGGRFISTNTASRVIPVHLKAERPYTGPMPDEFLHENYKRTQSNFFDWLRSKGHDSWIPEEKGGRLAVALRDPTQIKSVYNRTFDPKQKRMDKDAGGPVIENAVSVFPKPQRMFPDDAPVPGGQYLNAATKEDMTGHKAAMASIGVEPGGKPYFRASPDGVDETGTPGKGSAIAKTNLFKQRAGWRWSQAPEGHENTNTIVSVEHRGKHIYALNAHFPKGVDLARYENASSEPRLRPTTRGNVELGPQVGSILVRGKEHPVHGHVIVRQDGGRVIAPRNMAIVDKALSALSRKN